MHNIEPYYNWIHLYSANKDERTPFYAREYSEFHFTDKIYNHLIHPQWDNFGSPTLFLKILYTDYHEHYCIIELIGEWNDCIENDIMTLLHEILEPMQLEGITKFVLIGENVLNFHSSDDEYYQDWNDNNPEGWVCLVNFLPHVLEEMASQNIDAHWIWGGELNEMEWRKLKPSELIQQIEKTINHWLV
jgi:hypothetical protein